MKLKSVSGLSKAGVVALLASTVFLSSLAHAASVSVTLTTDTTNACATSGAAPCSLRDAIAFANANALVDSINFNIGGGGAQTITVTSALPTVARSPLTIDGSTQPGFAGTPLVLLTRSSASSFNGLQLSGGVTLKALAIGGFSAGVQITGTGNKLFGNYVGVNTSGNTAIANNINVQISSGGNNQIGGLNAGERNVISASNSTYGIQVQGAGGNLVQGNYIGTNAAGTAALGNWYDGINIAAGANNNTIDQNLISGNDAVGYANTGLEVDSNSNTITGNQIGTNAAGTAALPNIASGLRLTGSNNIVGGTTAATRNIITGNGEEGIRIDSGNNNQILGNYVGTDITPGTVPGNSQGLVIFGGSGHIVRGNVLSGNNSVGLQLQGSATGVTVENNMIGTDATGTVAIPNSYGVAFWQNAANSTIGGTAAGTANVIAMNNNWGVLLVNSTVSGISILGNSIFNNGAPGIEYYNNTPANHNQAAPVLTSVTPTVVAGTLVSTANTTFRIEYFATPKVNGVSPVAQGKTLLGIQNVMTDGSGNATLAFTGTVPAGAVVTATATNQATGDTSRFSTQISYNTPPVAQPQTLTTPQDTALPVTLTATDADGDTLTYAIAANPAHGALSGFNAATGTITYTPTAGFSGTDSFTFTANDGTATSTPAVISITVTGNTPPPTPNDATPIPTLSMGMLSLLVFLLILISRCALLRQFLARRR